MKKILIVSSSKLFLKRNIGLLQGRGLELSSTTSANEALKLHETSHYDLIISDVQLEDMEGSSLCSLINKEKELRHTPIILCCHAHHGSISGARETGASALLQKPLDPIQLLDTISKVLNQQIGRSKRVALKVKVISKKLGVDFICHSRDISNTGILVETDNELVLGDQLICQFKLPNSCEVETEGEVSRSGSTSDGKKFYGIKFINLAPAYFKAVDEYVNLKSHSFKRRY